MRKILFVAVCLMLTSCSRHYVNEIKDAAPTYLRSQGFEIVAYQGYQVGTFESWGGKVWYVLRRVPDNGVLYSAYLSKWGDEYHIYNLEAIDAIRSK